MDVVIDYERITEEHTPIPYDENNMLFSIKDDDDEAPYHNEECKCFFSESWHTSNMSFINRDGVYTTAPLPDWKPKYSQLYPIPAVEKLGPVPVWYED